MADVTPFPSRRFSAHRHVAVTGSADAALACVSVKRARDGSVDHYYSLAWVPPWRLGLWLRYRRNFRSHLTAQPAGRVWVEVPDHPIPFRRPRRRIA